MGSYGHGFAHGHGLFERGFGTGTRRADARKRNGVCTNRQHKQTPNSHSHNGNLQWNGHQILLDGRRQAMD